MKILPTPTSYIYGVVDPRSEAFIYVGRSKSPRNRLANMRARARRGEQAPLYKALRILLDAGVAPQVRLLEEVDAASETRSEILWIDQLRARGEPLVNSQLGGGPSSLAEISRAPTPQHANQVATQFKPLDPDSPTVRLEVRAPASLVARVAAEADARSLTRSDVVRLALRAWLDEHE